MRSARYEQRDRVLGVVPIDARYAGRGSVLGMIPTERPLYRRDPVPVWSAHATGNPNDGCRSTEHVVAADRFAREIVGFLNALFGARSRRLNSTVRPLGSVIGTPSFVYSASAWRALVVSVPACGCPWCWRGTTARGADCPLCRRGTQARYAARPLWGA